MTEETRFNLRNLPFSPTVNPLLSGFTMQTKVKRVQTGGVREFIDDQGVIHNAVIVEEEELDDLHFVKVFTAGIRAAFALSLTGSRVFQAVLECYQREPMSHGFADSIYLHFFDGGLSGVRVDLSDRTFRRGLKELLEKGFLYPRGDSLFWVNPNLFFRGNRATFIRTYRRRELSIDAPEIKAPKKRVKKLQATGKDQKTHSLPGV